MERDSMTCNDKIVLKNKLNVGFLNVDNSNSWITIFDWQTNGEVLTL
jgi:hypothetical protein